MEAEAQPSVDVERHRVIGNRSNSLFSKRHGVLGQLREEAFREFRNLRKKAGSGASVLDIMEDCGVENGHAVDAPGLHSPAVKGEAAAGDAVRLITYGGHRFSANGDAHPAHPLV